MAIFKCKMCGGSLDVAEGTTVCECEYCGTQQTIPKLHDDIMTNLFNRANHLRSKCEFDKAQEIYEKIVSQNPTEAEAYWGIILCKYGIEYVEDPATFRKIPTCHRTQLESVQGDADYLSALQNADTLQKEVYEREAAEIDRLQRDILSIVRNEKPFDVFICYKETDDSGKRTQDSVIANDIYHQLTQEGFKVFYAAITLEDKLGEAYEPYIFAALNSAKVMLVLGTKPEYFTAVWVRNEWSRYLQLAKKDHSRLLIPCYRDMDAYDLPDEFSHLQAQDMGKIGFINDVIRGIKKVLEKPDEQKTVRETIIQTGNANTAPLLKRAKMFLEDGDWKSAEEYCNKVLDLDPECSHAYYYQLMAELNIHTDAEFEQAEFPHGIADSECFKKAVRFADEQEKTRLNTLNQQVIYNAAESQFQKASTSDDFHDVREIYLSIETFKDAAEKAEQCKQKAQKCGYEQAVTTMENARNEHEFKNAEKQFVALGDYKDAAEKAEQCKENALLSLYEQAVTAMENARNEQECKKAAEQFAELNGFRDSKQKIAECWEKIEDCRKRKIYYEAKKCFEWDSVEEYNNAISKFESISDYRDSSNLIIKCKSRIEELKAEIKKKIQERISKEDKRKKLIFIVCIFIVICATACLIAFGIANVIV